MIVNRQGQIVDLNRTMLKLISRKKIQSIGYEFQECFTDPDLVRSLFDQSLKSGIFSMAPLSVINEHGSNCKVKLKGRALKNENRLITGMVLVAKVQSNLRNNNIELSKAKRLADKATQLAVSAQLNAEEQQRISENSVKAKQQFLSNMSHEIRTPMNAIIGFTKVLLKTEMSTKQSEYLLAIKASGDALIVLINDILDLAKVDSGKMSFDLIPFKLERSISAMLHVFESKILEKNLELIKNYDANIPEFLIGDPIRLHQIILNLVSNAVKFTSIGSITINIQLEEEDERKVGISFSVIDTGIGIHEDHLETIFENFHQATSGTSRLYGGTGLGLAIVKQLVEAQGGNIQLYSALGKGSSFKFRLDFDKTDSVETQVLTFEPVNSEIQNIDVLVVEDIQLNQLLMKTLLDEFGFNMDIASNGKIAIERLKEKSYDIVLMDLQMPEMNGFEATEYIRNTLKLDLPIIALTADVTTTDIEKCKAVGMNDYVSKPIDERILLSKILFHFQKSNKGTAWGKKPQSKNVNSCINMNYLHKLTRSNPVLMHEMISIYLEQTPPLLDLMKVSLRNKNWEVLSSTAHKLIPSFSMMGIDLEFENVARKVQQFAEAQIETEEIHTIVLQLDNICHQACIELEEIRLSLNKPLK